MSSTDDSQADSPHPPAVPAGAGPADLTQRLLRSEELLQGHREVLILHCHELYRLRLTRNGKLILTK